MKKTRVVVCVIFAVLLISFSLFVYRTTRNPFPEEKREADALYAELQSIECTQEYKRWDEKYIASGERICICLWGDCDLQDIFEISERANEYLETHPDSIINTRNMGVCIEFFDHEPSRHDYERYRYYACVTKNPDDALISEFDMKASAPVEVTDFRNCSVPYNRIGLTYAADFRDSEALLTVEGLTMVAVHYEVGCSKEDMLRVLQEVCYYDEHDINLDFSFGFGVGSDAELERIYNDFVKAHADYKVFQDENGELFLYDEN